MYARRKGFIERCKALAISCEVVVSKETDRQWIESMLTAKPRPTACVSYRCDDACRVIYVAQQLGLSVPADLSVISFSPKQEWFAGLLPLSLYQVPIYEVGRQAIQQLLVKLETPGDDESPVQHIPLNWLEGETVASCPADGGAS
jgi:DNA-binding LacI/PurR family transcriptional regulator